MTGFINLNKPSGPTSHDMVDFMRRLTGIRKIGHAGTLDPFASGVLILAIGREATKRISVFLKTDKQYEAEIFFGASSDTYDRQGKIKAWENVERPSEIEVSEAVFSFLGKKEQVPPAWSAKKINGRKAYELARRGQKINLKPAMIEIISLEILSYEWPILKLKIGCSPGTYIRSLADDLGRKLKTGAYLKELARTAIGKRRLEDAVGPDRLDSANWTDFVFEP